MAGLEHRVSMSFLCHSWDTALTVCTGVGGNDLVSKDCQQWSSVQVLIPQEIETLFLETLPWMTAQFHNY